LEIQKWRQYEPEVFLISYAYAYMSLADVYQHLVEHRVPKTCFINIGKKNLVMELLKSDALNSIYHPISSEEFD
jgi:hypothetical protein